MVPPLELLLVLVVDELLLPVVELLLPVVELVLVVVLLLVAAPPAPVMPPVPDVPLLLDPVTDPPPPLVLVAPEPLAEDVGPEVVAPLFDALDPQLAATAAAPTSMPAFAMLRSGRFLLVLA